jgi:hypothetical protein
MWQYFKRFIADQTCQAIQWTKITTISDDAQDPSYTIAELVILPECCKIVNIMLGKEHEKGGLKICMPNNTINHHIQDMFQDVESQVTANLKEADFFCHPVG